MDRTKYQEVKRKNCRKHSTLPDVWTMRLRGKNGLPGEVMGSGLLGERRTVYLCAIR